jgi:hypothetical protein
VIIVKIPEDIKQMIETADTEYTLFQEMLKVHKENYYKCVQAFLDSIGDTCLYNKQIRVNGWLELKEDPDNLLHPYSFRFVPMNKDGSRSGRSRVINGYDTLPTVEQRLMLLAGVLEPVK